MKVMENDYVFKEVNKIVSPVYLVGGAIRNELLRLPSKDWDFCTPLLPDEIENQIREAGRKPYLTGKRFGTIGLTVNGCKVEITTFRKEQYSKNNRKPEVSFGASLKEDLGRRDFGINAIAKDVEGKYIDYFGGRMDILERKIKAINKPKTMLKDDPLRALRAARFMSQLNFEIDEFLEAEIKRFAYKILLVSKERWVQELDKILESDNPIIGLSFLMRNDLFNYMIPELSLQYKFDQQSPWHVHDLWTHTRHVVNNCPKDLNLRWAALLHDVGKPFVQKFKKGDGVHPDRMRYLYHDFLGADVVKSICAKLKFSNERTDYVVDTVRNHMKPGSVLEEYDKFTNDKPSLKEYD